MGCNGSNVICGGKLQADKKQQQLCSDFHFGETGRKFRKEQI